MGFKLMEIHGLKGDLLRRKEPYGMKIIFKSHHIHSGKLAKPWKMDPLKMYVLWKMGTFHCYVSLPEGRIIVLKLFPKHLVEALTFANLSF